MNLLQNIKERNIKTAKRITIFSGLLITMVFLACSKNIHKPEPRLQTVHNWVCSYNKKIAPAALAPFDLAVLDAAVETDITAIQNKGTRVIGYISLAEIQPFRWYWPLLEGSEAILPQKTAFGGYFIDVRTEKWRTTVLDSIIPAILKRGFDGLFLDTIDTAEYLENLKSGKRLPGAQNAMIGLIRLIRKKFPTKIIIANRGFSMLPQFAPFVDAVLAESVLTEFKAKSGLAALRAKESYAGLLQEMQKFQSAGGLVLSLDYTADSSPFISDSVLKLAAEYHFLPYLSDPKLDKIYYTAPGRENGH